MQNNQSQLRYIMYCRKSSDSEDRQVQSIEDQKRELEPIVRSRGLNVVKVFSESQSAKQPGRPEFNEMIRMLEQGEADGIISWKCSRLARNPIDGGKIQWLLQEGIIKSIITPSKEYLQTDNVLMMAVELGMATQYSIDLSNDVIRGMKSKINKGWRPMRAPIGYLPDRLGLKGEKRILEDPERFDIVQQVWHLFLTGQYTVKQILDKATNEWGLRTRETPRVPSGKFSLGGIYAMLTNPFYYGSFLYKDELYEGNHKPMITKDEFDMVQKILGRAGKPRPKHKRLPFTGFIECGECRGMIVADEKQKMIKSEGRIKKFIYHRCSKRKKDTVCHQMPIKHEVLAEQVIAYLDSITIPQEFLHWAIDVLRENNQVEEQTRGSVLANHRKNYDNCLKRVDNLINLFVSPANAARELLTDEEYKAQKAGLMSEKAQIEGEVRKVEAGVDQWLDLTEKTFNFATYAKHWFDKGDYEQKTNILRAIGKNFTFMDGKLHIDLQKPFLTLKEGLETEPLKTALQEPVGLVLDKTQNTPLGGVYSRWSG